jgi:hypothetical protein
VRIASLAAQADLDQASERLSRPLTEAGTRLHHARARVQRAWRTVTEGQATLAKNRRVHAINGVTAEIIEPVEPLAHSGAC